MRYLFGVTAIVVAGVLTWQIGARLSTDAVGMGVGLIFGVLAGVPAMLLILATDRRGRGVRDDEALTPFAPLAPYVRTAPYVPTVIVVESPQYTPARPFATQPAPERTAHCANWELCPDCHWPLTPDEHCAEWCGVQPSGRKFRVTGEAE